MFLLCCRDHVCLKHIDTGVGPYSWLLRLTGVCCSHRERVCCMPAAELLCEVSGVNHYFLKEKYSTNARTLSYEAVLLLVMQ